MNETDRSNIYTALSSKLVKTNVFLQPLIQREETADLFQDYLAASTAISYNEARAICVLAKICNIKLTITDAIKTLAKTKPGRTLRTMWPELRIIAYDENDLSHVYDLWLARMIERLPMAVNNVGPFIVGMKQPVDGYVHDILFLACLNKDWRHYKTTGTLETGAAVQTLYAIIAGTPKLPYHEYEQVITPKHIVSISNERDPYCIALKYPLVGPVHNVYGLNYYKTNDVIAVFNAADVLVAYKDDSWQSKLTNSADFAKLVSIDKNGKITVEIVYE